MEFPNDISTNVFKIEDVKEISWAYYSLPDEKRREQLDAVSKKETAALTSNIYHTEWLLRTHGKHVLSDACGIWVFSLSDEEKQDVLQILTSDGFTCTGSGVERSSDVDPISKPDVSMSRPRNAITPASAFADDRVQLNVQAHSVNTQAMIYLERKDQIRAGSSIETINLRTRLSLAISQSLCHALSKDSGYLQLGSNKCIDVDTLADAELEDLGTLKAGHMTVSLSFGIEWLSSGSLLITYTHKEMTRLRRLSRFPLGDQDLVKLEPKTLIFLSPSGMACRYLGVDTISTRNPLFESDADLKASISAHLVRIGMSVPPNTCWLRVLLENHPSEEVLSEHTTSTTGPPWTIWPAHFCLCKDMSRPFQDNTVAEQDPVTAYDFCDPLAKAESWFLSASVRLRSLEVKRQKLALEAQEIQEPDGTDDEDTLYDLEFQATQGITPQDVSGIYPTPPDGIRSSLTVSSPTNVQNQVDREAEQSVHPTPQASNRPYAEHESGDLFDEIEMDMFTANGLTEADFSFFDEPSPAYEELQHDGHVIVEDDDFAPRGESPMNVFPQGTRDPSSAPPIAVCQMDSSPVLDPGVSPEVSLALETFGSAVQSQISSESQIVDHDQSPTKIEIQPSEENAVDPGWMNRETQAAQKTSFDTVPFRAKSFEFDDKYALTGRYGFGLDDLANPVDQGGLLPHKTESLPQIGIAYVNGSQSEADAMTGWSEQQQLLVVITDVSDTDDTVEERQALASGLVEDTVALDVMEESPQITSLKRKRTSKDHSRNSSPHNSPAPTDSESLGHVAQEPCSPALGLFSATTFEDPKQSSMTMLGSEDSHKPRFTGRDKTFIQVAQTLADQAVSGLGISDLYDRIPSQYFANLVGSHQRIACILAGFATNAGKRSRRCSLKGLASLGSPNIAHGSIEQIGHPPAQKLQRPTFPTRASTAGLQSIFKLHTPYTRVQRTGTSIDVNASALRFWEELSLAPSHGSKDVTAFCIYPVNLDIHSNVKTFLEMVGGAYQSCKMGTFVRGSCPVERSQSLPTVPSDTTSGSQDLLSRMKLACDQFGQSLGDQRLQHGNTAVYFANFYGPQHLPTICAGFLKLFEAYNVTVKQKQVDQPNDLLLQIIPSELIYSSDIIAMPSPSDYRRLALEVYDRCGPNCSNERKRNPQYVSAPAIRLAKAIPKSIDLRLNPDSSGPVLQTDNCLHVAYAWDISDRWLTASWTDNLGILSWNACYCFGEPEEAPWQSFSDVAKEIWETTCDMMRSRNVPWRLFICKDGAAHSKESDTWQALLMNHTKPSIISTFLTVETDPLLRFPFFDAQNNGSELVSYPLATPGATPQPNAPSPDVGSTPTGASAQVSTPPAGNAFGDSYDADARLIDITEETWGVILSTNLSSFSYSERSNENACRPLASAYLIKRAGPRNEDGLVRMALDFLSGQMGYKMIMKEVLSMYAGLGLLARARGVVDGVRGVLPLHVAAARKAHAVVNSTMRYGDG